MTNYNLYKIFICVAEQKNITLASQILYISQPAISQDIKNLERQVGGVLFERKNKGVKLTNIGKLLYDKVKPIVNNLEKLEDFGKTQKLLKDGFLRIAYNSSNCNQIIANSLKEFVSLYPDIKVKVKRNDAESIIKELNDNEIDIAFIDNAKSDENIKIVKNYSIEYQLIGSKKYYDIYNNSPLTNKNFPKEEIILPSLNNNSRKYIDEYLQENLITINPKYELDNYITIYDFVKSGFGVAFVNLNYYKKEINSKEVYPLNSKIKARKFSALENSSSINPAKTKFIELLLK